MVWGHIRGSLVRAVALVNAFLLLTGLTLLSSAGPDPLNRTSLVALTTVQARATGDFLDSIGVNTHMGYPATPYATNPSLIAQRLRELGSATSGRIFHSP